METNGKVGAMIFAFILLVVGITFATTIGNSTSQAVTTQTNLNETCSMASAVLAGSLSYKDYVQVECTMADDDIYSVNAVRWDNMTALVSATDYNVTIPATTTSKVLTFSVMNTTSNAGIIGITNTTQIDYSYYPDGYVKNSTGRTLFSSFLVLFFVLAILGTVLGILLKSGVINFNF